MREIIKKAYMMKVKEKRELKSLVDKMFSLESDLVFFNSELEQQIENGRKEFQKEIQDLDEELERMREEHQFTVEEKHEMKRQLDNNLI